MKRKSIIASAIFITTNLTAGEVRITEDLKSIEIKEDDKKITIKRIQDTKNRLKSSFTKTSRECPPFCVQPMRIGNVETIGELELLKYIKDMQKSDNEMLLIDARTREWYREGSIPSAINLPFTMLKRGSKYLTKILTLLGATERHGEWNFDKVPKMIIFGNGIWDGQASKEIKSLISLGCPEDKILYYRGGMQNWYILGLTTK